MKDVTLILQRIEQGKAQGPRELFPLVYDELRRIAGAKMTSERADHTLSATALVNEAYVQLVDTETVQTWDSRGHFFSAAAEAMRRILIHSARRKGALKRGGDRKRVDLSDEPTTAGINHDVIELSDGLEWLAQEDVKAAELVKLRLFAGLSVEEAGKMLGMSRSTAYENWEFARAWFTVRLN